MSGRSHLGLRARDGDLQLDEPRLVRGKRKPAATKKP